MHFTSVNVTQFLKYGGLATFSDMDESHQVPWIWVPPQLVSNPIFSSFILSVLAFAFCNFGSVDGALADEYWGKNNYPITKLLPDGVKENTNNKMWREFTSWDTSQIELEINFFGFIINIVLIWKVNLLS